MNLVFIYGTLKHGFTNYDDGLLGDRCIGVVRSIVPYPLVVTGRWFSPVVLPERGQGLRIRGELYRVDDSILEKLDTFEGVGQKTGYARYEIEVETDSGERLTAWCYMKDRSVVGQVHSHYLSDYQDQRYIPRDRRPLI